MKIAILIPSTSNGRDWKTIEETYLYKHTLKTFLLTYDKEYNYKFFIGIDRGDKIYDNEIIKGKIERFLKIMKNVELEFVYMENVEKGHLTVMWNQLYDKALNENYDYYYQCGDDIEFKTKNWVRDFIIVLKKSNDIGVVGQINNNPRILTQTFVSKKHKDLFGYYFPPEIINWFCDDWINNIYKKLNCFYPQLNHFVINVGGVPRYNINNDKNYHLNREINWKSMENNCKKIVERDYKNLKSSKLI